MKSLALDHWTVATWFDLWATYFWILQAQMGHLCSKLQDVFSTGTLPHDHVIWPPGHLSFESLAPMGHQLSKLNDITDWSAFWRPFMPMFKLLVTSGFQRWIPTPNAKSPRVLHQPFCKFFAENCKKKKEFGREGYVPGNSAWIRHCESLFKMFTTNPSS